jgi:uncharacterized damage-inducible protein DinB
MSRVDSLRECFTFNDWARQRLLGTVQPLADAQLDRPFSMGEGSLRKTLFHLWASEYGWLNRWQPQTDGYDAACHGEPLAEIARRFETTAARRNAFLAELGERGLDRTATYTNAKGMTLTFRFADMMLHVCTHGVHHRAQALGMLRQLGVPRPEPGLDYVFMKLQQQENGAATTPALVLPIIQAYQAHGDWARARVLAASAELGDAALDRTFELGRGTLRATLAHLDAAELWWLGNWTRGPGRLFPPFNEREPLAELAQRGAETRAQRAAFMAGLTDSDLSRPVSATPRADVQRTFPLGVTMLQLTFHGVHHRAQALNLLRQLGAQTPALDYIAMIREQQAAQRA